MRIVTYNTRGSLGIDGRRSTPRIADAVRALSPDVICFQEIHQRLAWSGREDQPDLLAKLLRRPFLFQRNLTFGFGGYGIGVATRGSVLARKEHPLPSVKEQRGALEVRIQDIGGLHTVTIICTHWGLQAEERLRQAEALAAIVKAATPPVILCGDLNESAESCAVRSLRVSVNLMDADAAQNRATFVSNNPTVRIDYILYTPDLVARNVEVISSLASDHLPVLADLERAP
jgi:endonuclease/exonuclease/phosphatase family metal-dependent hydrolase